MKIRAIFLIEHGKSLLGGHCDLAIKVWFIEKGPSVLGISQTWQSFILSLVGCNSKTLRFESTFDLVTSATAPAPW
jgi:hypothetical protein